MSQSPDQIHPAVRRLALAVTLIALIPITLGTFVTTLGAGMAFADWPSSDGHNMLMYPWLRDFRTNPDKFIEHGHRLAGILIGLVSLLLVVVTLRVETRSWVRGYTFLILAAVIAQGLLGGARVLLDRQTLAMLHSITGALFFVLTLLFLVLTSSRWLRLTNEADSRTGPFSLGLIVSLPAVVLGQYLLGGALRHLHTMLDEHLGGALLVTLWAIGVVFALFRAESPSMVLAGRLIAMTLGVQILIGMCAYLTRFGFAPTGMVATAGSLQQNVACSLHTVGGMLLFGASTYAMAVGIQLHRLGRLSGLNDSVESVVAGPVSGGSR